MASAARRARGAERRPFAVLVSPSPARNGGAFTSAENVVATEGMPSAQRGRRFGKCAGGGKAARKCAGSGLSLVSSVSKKPATTVSRRRVCSRSVKCSTPAAAKKARDPPRAPLRDLSEDRDGKVRANLSPPFDEVGRGRQEQRRGGGAASRKRTVRSMATEEGTTGLPEPGEGRVKYLVDTFERLLTLAGGGPEARRRRKNNETTTTARTSSASSQTPPQPAAEEIDVSYPSVASSHDVSFPTIAGVACILDASDHTSMIRAAREQRRQRRCNRNCNREVTSVTRQRPFNLRTEQRGKAKEENFVQRMRKMQLEEEMMCNPLAQGLPFTTDEPEYPVKPPTKEPTEPIDLVLHSDVRAVGRAKFDHQVAERTSFMEEVKLAKERQQKMDEEIEIKQLRKEQVPRAHPMPDFTKPFVPKRSMKPHTIPREPRFHPRLIRNTVKA